MDIGFTIYIHKKHIGIKGQLVLSLLVQTSKLSGFPCYGDG